jgi:RND family efflux transporter MFP subunit
MALLLTGCTLFPAEAVEKPIPLIIPPEPERSVFTVKRGPIEEQVRATGRIASQQEATLYFRDGGRVLRVAVKPGDTVTPGQTLAVLETGDLDVRLNLAELSLRQAKLKLEQTEQQAQLKGEAASKYDLEYARIEVERQQILYDQLRRQMDGATLTAAFPGKVTAANIKPGDNVQGLAPVITVVDPGALEVRAEIPSDETLAKLGVGRKAQLKISAGSGGEAKATGTIVQMPDPTQAPQPGQGKNQVRIAFEDGVPKDAHLGDLVQITVVVREAKDALIIPNAAIRSYAGRLYVSVLQGETKKEVDIQLGIQTETESEVLKGLEEGEQVIGK